MWNGVTLAVPITQQAPYSQRNTIRDKIQSLNPILKNTFRIEGGVQMCVRNCCEQTLMATCMAEFSPFMPRAWPSYTSPKAP